MRQQIEEVARVSVSEQIDKVIRENAWSEEEDQQQLGFQQC